MLGGSAAAAVAQGIYGYPNWKATLVTEVVGCCRGSVDRSVGRLHECPSAGDIADSAMERELFGGANAVGGRALLTPRGGSAHSRD